MARSVARADSPTHLPPYQFDEPKSNTVNYSAPPRTQNHRVPRAHCLAISVIIIIVKLFAYSGVRCAAVLIAPGRTVCSAAENRDDFMDDPGGSNFALCASAVAFIFGHKTPAAIDRVQSQLHVYLRDQTSSASTQPKIYYILWMYNDCSHDQRDVDNAQPKPRNRLYAQAKIRSILWFLIDKYCTCPGLCVQLDKHRMDNHRDQRKFNDFSSSSSSSFSFFFFLEFNDFWPKALFISISNTRN